MKNIIFAIILIPNFAFASLAKITCFYYTHENKVHTSAIYSPRPITLKAGESNRYVVSYTVNDKGSNRALCSGFIGTEDSDTFIADWSAWEGPQFDSNFQCKENQGSDVHNIDFASKVLHEDESLEFQMILGNSADGDPHFFKIYALKKVDWDAYQKLSEDDQEDYDFALCNKLTPVKK